MAKTNLSKKFNIDLTNNKTIAASAFTASREYGLPRSSKEFCALNFLSDFVVYSDIFMLRIDSLLSYSYKGFYVMEISGNFNVNNYGVFSKIKLKFEFCEQIDKYINSGIEFCKMSLK